MICSHAVCTHVKLIANMWCEVPQTSAASQLFDLAMWIFLKWKSYKLVDGQQLFTITSNTVAK